MNKHFVSIIERIKEIKGLHTDAQVAKVLEITKNNLYASKTRDSLPLKHLHAFCLKENVRLDYLITGTLPIHEHVAQKVSEPEAQYQGASLRRVTDNIPLKISDLIHKTSYILESDTPHKLAFVSIIEACYRAVQSEEQINKQNQKIIELEEKIEALVGSLPPAVSE